MPALSPDIIQPAIAAIIPMMENVVDRIADLYEQDHLDLTATQALVEDPATVRLRRLDDPGNPLIKFDEATGERTLVLLWGHPSNLKDTDYTVGILCRLEQNGQGQWMFKPSLVMRGEKANMLIVGGMSCCGAAIQTHWNCVMPDGGVIDEGRMPISGLMHPEHENWLEGKVYVANSEEAKNALSHMVIDILAHRAPERFPHACTTSPDYLAYAPARGGPGMAPR